MIASPRDEGEATLARAHALVHALREHRDETIVVKLGGATIEDGGIARAFADDLSSLRAAGVRPVVVHGGGPQVTGLATRLGIGTRFVDGRRVTDAGTLGVATMVLAGTISTAVVASLLAAGVPAVGLSGVDGGLLMAAPRSGGALGFVGEITAVDHRVVSALLQHGYVPVVTSLALGDGGQHYNVNADEAAAELAIGLGARELVVLSDVPGLIGPEGLVRALSVSAAEEILSVGGVVDGGMVPKLGGVVRALRGGVQRAHLIDGRIAHALLLELLTRDGIGTVVTDDLPTEEAEPQEQAS